MPFCPSCRYEYRPEIKRCPDCDVALVDQLPPEVEPPRLVAVASFQFEPQAQVARLKLERLGISAFIANEKIAQTDIVLAFADGGVHVVVRQDDAARACKILEEEEDE